MTDKLECGPPKGMHRAEATTLDQQMFGAVILSQGGKVEFDMDLLEKRIAIYRQFNPGKETVTFTAHLIKEGL